MLVCTIELWPGGNPERSRRLGEVLIANDGTGDERRGNYNCAVTHAGKYAHRNGVWRTGRVSRHMRTRSPYHLLAKALGACLGGLPDRQAPEWADRLLGKVRRYRENGQAPTAAELMQAWLATDEAKSVPEDLVEYSPVDVPPTPLETLEAAVTDLLEIVGEPEPPITEDAREYWCVVAAALRKLGKAYGEYAMAGKALDEKGKGSPA